jgi:hypothetical protein
MKLSLIVAFFCGWLLSEAINRHELQQAATQVETAEAAVTWAHHEIDMLEGCHVRTPVITANQEDRHAPY